ncbi:hypothetical protein BASA81_006724 [Batrachochytrium salamandrivorans]|nr:hypothetical protein BASA81_006724 [Batrachochytrium salamandrivorans]
MTSSYGSLKGGWSNELESLEKLMRVFEELGGEQEDEIHDLVAVSRMFVREGEIMVREAPFASSKKERHHVYLFNDLLIMGKPPTTPGGGNRKYKLTHFIVLKQCTFKESPKPDGDGHFVETLTQVSRHRTHADGTLAESHDIHARIVTRIEKLELAFESAKHRQEFMTEIHLYLDEVEREMIARKDSAMLLDEKSATGGQLPVKQRSWAAKKKHGTLTRKLHNANGDEISSETTTDSVGGYSLADLEAKYSMDFKTPHNDKEHSRVEFEICFGDGPMGFSLGSAPGVGVLIGRLAPHSFAEAGGVCIGDRIAFVEQEAIPLDINWQDVVEKLKKHSRPVTITFERSSVRQMEHEEHDEHDADSTMPATSTVTSTDGEATDPVKKQRSWANRRAQNAATTGGVINLGDLEKVYSKAEKTGSKDKDEQALKVFAQLQASNDAEKTSAAVLKEILVSEMAYVADLRCLVGEYILPLRRTSRRGKCREIEGGSAICEHNMIRATCLKSCIEATPLMDAEDMKSIFCNTETLMTVNTELLHQLQFGLIKLGEKTTKPSLKDVAGVYAPAFHTIMPFFKMYSVYCHQYHVAIERLLDCRSSNAELHQFLLDREQKSQFNSLSGLLIKPIQRICKYPLLFSTLLNELGKSGQSGITPFIAELKKAADTIEAIAMSVNKQVGESEAMEDLLEAYDELGGIKGAPGLVEAHRKFVRTEDVLYHSSAADKEGEYHEKMLYLFNDLLVVAKSTHGGASSSSTLIHKLSSSNSLYRKTGMSRHLSMAKGMVSKKSSSANNGGGGGATSQIAKIEQWLDISTLTPVAMEMKEAAESKKFGINIKHISRKTEEAPKRATLSLKRSTAHSLPTNSGKIITVVERFEIWFFEEDKRDEFLKDLQKQIDHQEELQTGQRRAQNTVGTPKTQRSWTRKTRHDSNIGGGGHGRTSSAGNALSEIEGKYSKN